MRSSSRKTFWLGAALIAIGLASHLTPAGPRQASAPAFRIEDLAWLSGDWETEPGASRTDEHWSRVAGGSLMGTSRTVSGDRTVFFEHLRIERRGSEIYYVAHPKGRSPGTDFKLVRLSGQEAVFKNPAHDFPKRIAYRKNADGTLTARVEGDGTEKEKAQEYRYRPVPRSN